MPPELLAYELPPELIAQEPLADRSSSRLLVLDRSGGTLDEAVFRDLGRWLKAGDLLVLNETRVFKGRVRARRRGFPGRLELLFFEDRGDRTWAALVKPSRRVRPGDLLEIGATGTAAVIGREQGGVRIVRFPDDVDPHRVFESEGEVPIPPYVERPVELDRYQTTYARRPGAVAAPTAGFHFDGALFATLAAAGVETVRVTLHVGPGTFLPVREADFRRHRMHREWYQVEAEASDTLRRAFEAGRRIIPVGSTSMRVIETLARAGELGHPASGFTDLYLTPGDRFQVSSGLITNFHLPRTTLLLLVMAFAGVDAVGRAYREAIARRFRFYSFGDAMLIL